MPDYSLYVFPDANWSLIPQHMHEGIWEYVMNGRPTGSFLRAIIEDAPISECFARSDNDNQRAMLGWMNFLYNFVPAVARRNYYQWCESGGVFGQMKAAQKGETDD